MKKALIIMNEDFVNKVYDKEARRQIDQYYDVLSEPLTKEN